MTTGDTHQGVDAREETDAERQDRKFGDILQELRVVMTGTQLITGFLLAVAFQPTFDDLTSRQVALYLTLVVLATTASLLGLGPVVLHRHLSGQFKKDRVVAGATTLLVVLLVVVSLVAAGVATLIFGVVLSERAGWIAGAVGLAVLVAFWLAVRALARRRGN